MDPSGSHVYFGAGDNTMRAVSSATGETQWSFRAGDYIKSTPLLKAPIDSDATYIYVCSANGVIYKLRGGGQGSVKAEWAYPTGAAIRFVSYVLPDRPAVHVAYPPIA